MLTNYTVTAAAFSKWLGGAGVCGPGDGDGDRCTRKTVGEAGGSDGDPFCKKLPLTVIRLWRKQTAGIGACLERQ